jgi:hypothetical protein
MSQSSSCLHCKKDAPPHIYDVEEGCRRICYFCRGCFDDAKVDDAVLLADSKRGCTKCQPALAKAIIKRSCAHCRKLGQPAMVCNCEQGAYLCRSCQSNPDAERSLKLHHAVRTVLTPTTGTKKRFSWVK